MKINEKLKTFLEESNVKVSICEDDVELENYTDAGGDKIITLVNLEVKELEEYLNTYDINEEVLLWWKDGADGKRTPFDNIIEHVQDEEKWLNDWKALVAEFKGEKRTKTIHDAPCEPLVLCFNIDPHLLDTDERIEVLSDMTDEELYKEACEGVEIGLADIYALGDFLGDLTNGELKDKYYYYRYVMVSRAESDKWLK